MATGYIGKNETLPQIVITPNKGKSKEGAHKLGQAGDAAQQEQPRLSPAQIRNRSATLGKDIAASKDGEGYWGNSGFFGALIDIINPLQHIPGVSTAYRAMTGDEIGFGPRVIGGALLGGVFGLAASVVGAIVNAQTGKDLGDHALAALRGDGGNSSGSTQLAQAQGQQAQSQRSAAQEMLQPSPGQTAARLSSTDALMAMAEDFDPPPSAAELLAAQKKAQIPLGENDIGRDRAVYTLGGLENATRRYQQMQMMDKLQTTALGMDIKG